MKPLSSSLAHLVCNRVHNKPWKRVFPATHGDRRECQVEARESETCRHARGTRQTMSYIVEVAESAT